GRASAVAGADVYLQLSLRRVRQGDWDSQLVHRLGALHGGDGRAKDFPERQRDAESNLDKTHFRMFSSDQGRWFSPDPKAGCGGNPQNHTRYAYVRTNPANGIDPRGDYVCTGDQCSSEESQVCTARDRIFGATTAICTLYAIVSP